MARTAATPIAMSVSRADAVETVAARAGLPAGGGGIGAAGVTLAAVFTVLGPVSNAHVAIRDSAEGDGITSRLVFGGQRRYLEPPLHLTDAPDCFTPGSPVADSPDLRLFTVPGGYLCHFPDGPMVLTESGETVVRDCSGGYAGLIHYYDADIRRILADALSVDGTVAVIADDVRPLNYRHFLADWLPRLAGLGELAGRDDVYVATPPLDAPWQWEVLRSCGFPRPRVIELKSWQSLRARQLIVPDDFDPVPHPGHKAAPWLLAYLRATLGFALQQHGGARPIRPGKLYVRSGPLVGDEPALAAALRLAGYRPIEPWHMSAAAQVAAFASATHIVGAHFEALTNVVFAQPGTRVIELFPAAGGTPATYLLASGAGLTYASYRAAARADRCEVDIDDFLRRGAGLL